MSKSLALLDIDTPVGITAENVDQLTLRWKLATGTTVRVGVSRVLKQRLERDLIRYHVDHRLPEADELIGVTAETSDSSAARGYLDEATARVSLEASAFVLYVKHYDKTAGRDSARNILKFASAYDSRIQTKRFGGPEIGQEGHRSLAISVYRARAGLPVSMASKPTLVLPRYNDMARGCAAWERKVAKEAGAEVGTPAYFEQRISMADGRRGRLAAVLLDDALSTQELDLRTQAFGRDVEVLGSDRSVDPNGALPSDLSGPSGRPPAAPHRPAVRTDSPSSTRSIPSGGPGVSF